MKRSALPLVYSTMAKATTAVALSHPARSLSYVAPLEMN